MKVWNEDQRRYVLAHLQVDMTAAELGRVFRVAPQEVWLLWKTEHRSCGVGIVPIHPLGFHSPGGGMLLEYLGIRGAIQADAYETMSMADFRKLYPDGQRDLLPI